MRYGRVCRSVRLGRAPGRAEGRFERRWRLPGLSAFGAAGGPAHAGFLSDTGAGGICQDTAVTQAESGPEVGSFGSFVGGGGDCRLALGVVGEEDPLRVSRSRHLGQDFDDVGHGA